MYNNWTKDITVEFEYDYTTVYADLKVRMVALSDYGSDADWRRGQDRYFCDGYDILNIEDKDGKVYVSTPELEQLIEEAFDMVNQEELDCEDVRDDE